MNKLPLGWKSVPIIELLAPLADGRIIHQGWSPQCAQGASPNSDVWGVLKTTSIQNGRFLPEHNKLLPDALEPRILLEVHEGDILLTCAGPRIRCGVPCLVRSTRPKLIMSGKMYRMRAMEPYIDSRFVEAMLRAPVTQEAIDQIKTGMSESGMNLTHARFAKIEIPVPPTNEQKRIVDKLDAVLARVDACRDHLDRIPVILKRFRQSVLATAMSGQLTADWRSKEGQKHSVAELIMKLQESKVELVEAKKINKDLAFSGETNFDSTIPNEWALVNLASICSKITDGEHITPRRTASGKWLISARNVINSSIKLDVVDFVDDEEFLRLRKRCDPQIGDILISCSGSVGRIALVDKDDAYVMVRSAAMIRPLPDFIDVRYLCFSLQSLALQKQIEDRSKSTAQANLFLGEIKQLVTPYPPLAEQHEIIRRVESLFAYADSLEARYTAARAQVEKLPSALLAKAFRGELVPQDPSDEPASELLARIAAAKPLQTKKKATRKPS